MPETKSRFLNKIIEGRGGEDDSEKTFTSER
jgi:hypothetical protein